MSWPDRMYLQYSNVFNYIVASHINGHGKKEYVNADLIRQIQIETVKATLDEVSKIHGGLLVRTTVDPELIINGMNKEPK